MLSSLLLAACTPDPRMVICPVSTEKVAENPGCIGDNSDNKAPIGYERIAKADLPAGFYGIGVPLKSDAPLTLLTNPGLQDGWADKMVIKIPKTRQTLRTDSNPDGKFCKEESYPLCLGPIDGQFQFEVDGKTMMAPYSENLIVEFDPVVTPETLTLWASIDRSKKTTWEAFASSFHDVLRGDKLLNLGKFNPITNLGGEATREAVIKIYLKRIESWQYAKLVKDVKITIKGLTMPGITDATTTTGGGGQPSISNDALADAQRQQKVLDAENYREQAEAICGKDMVMTQVCVDHMRTFYGLLPPASYPIQPTAAPTAVPNPKKP